jgi:uncharacterized protein
MKNVKVAVIVGITLLSLSTAVLAKGPSFDCAKSSTKIEKLICANPDHRTGTLRLPKPTRLFATSTAATP